MKIYCTVGTPYFTAEQKKDLEKLGEVVYIDKIRIPEDEYINLVKDAEILIAAPEALGKLSEKIISSLPNLKYITLITVGYNWVDLEAIKKRNLSVSNVKGANSESVAEHIWGMTLDISKRISEFDRDIRNIGAYEFSKYKGLEVYGKTIGLIGTGDIGSKVARIAKGFNMKILGINKSGNSIEGIDFVDFNTLLSQSDIISISVPLNSETENLISEKEIKLMKNGVILINCAREKIIDKQAVINAIKTKKIGGLGIDTEILVPVSKEDPYLQYPNIIVNVHNAFNTVESDEKCYGLAVDNIKKFFEGKQQNII